MVLIQTVDRAKELHKPTNFYSPFSSAMGRLPSAVRRPSSAHGFAAHMSRGDYAPRGRWTKRCDHIGWSWIRMAS